MMTEDEIRNLKKQGLQEDIRNKLGIAKNIHPIFCDWIDEKDPNMKEKKLKKLQISIEKLGSSIDHILESFEFFEIRNK